MLAGFESSPGNKQGSSPIFSYWTHDQSTDHKYPTRRIPIAHETGAQGGQRDKAVTLINRKLQQKLSLHTVTMVLKGRICYALKWPIRPFKTKVTIHFLHLNKRLPEK